jgi:hypothetical protein
MTIEQFRYKIFPNFLEKVYSIILSKTLKVIILFFKNLSKNIILFGYF